MATFPSLRTVRRILVTGMSGTGKSSALDELRLLGFRTVDTDERGWSEWSDAEDGYVWREDRMAELLASDIGPALYVSGTVSNQGRFYDRFDAVVLLSASAEVLVGRIESRTNNGSGMCSGGGRGLPGCVGRRGIRSGAAERPWCA